MESKAKKTPSAVSKYFKEDEVRNAMAKSKEKAAMTGLLNGGASSRETKDSESFIEDSLKGEDAAAMPKKATVDVEDLTKDKPNLMMAVGKSDEEVEDSAGTINDSGKIAAMSEGNEEDAKASNQVDSAKIAALSENNEVDAKANKEEEKLLSVEQEMTERINGCKCAKEGCNATYYSAFLYEENGERTRFCTPCLRNAISSLSDEQKSTHLEGKARADKARLSKFQKGSLSAREGKTMDEHMYDILVDGDMPWFSVTRSGIVHIEEGCFESLIPLLEAVNFKFNGKINGKTNKPQLLMMSLRGRYDWKMLKPTIQKNLKPGWEKGPLTMYAEHFDLSKQSGGVPKFGACEEFLRYELAKARKRKEKKEAVKLATIEQVVEESKRNPADWMDSKVYQEALGLTGVSASLLKRKVKEAQQEDSKPAAKKTQKKKKSPVDGKENSNPVATEAKKKASTVAAGKRKKCDDYYDSDEDDSDKDKSGGSNYVKRVTKSGRVPKKV